MGTLFSRNNAGVEEVDLGPNHVYRYPPKTGNYFGSHFIMGGERFDYDPRQSEAYLFGENSDLNCLGSRPSVFPYSSSQPGEPTKTLKALVNIRRESLRFVKAVDEGDDDGVPKSSTRFNIEFTFDADCRCAITISYFCTEEVTSTGLNYVPRDANMSSETHRFKKGANQQFMQSVHIFDPSAWPDKDLFYSPDKENLPVVIQCVAEEGEEPRQQHISIAVVEKFSDGTFGLKAFKQKLFIDGLCYLLQEIYGIENKQLDGKVCNSEEDSDGGECVVCMCDVRDTLILPCRHLCLCNGCADSLRYQASCCPICRAPFRALLQVRAVQRCSHSDQAAVHDHIPVGYEPVSLIEALNGSTTRRGHSEVRTTREVLRHSSRSSVASTRGGMTEDSTTQTDPHTTPPARRANDVRRSRHSSKERGGSRTLCDNEEPSETRSLLEVSLNVENESGEKPEEQQQPDESTVTEPQDDFSFKVSDGKTKERKLEGSSNSTTPTQLSAPVPGTPGSKSDRDSFSSSGSTKLLLAQQFSDSTA